MHNSFTSHNSSSGESSVSIFNYLTKERESLNDKSLLLNNENFFSNDFDAVNNNGSDYSKFHCINEIDNNISSSHRSKHSSYYMINTSPSEREIKHLELKAEEILKERGLELNSDATEDFKKYYLEQKNITIDILLKDYINDLMSIYAEDMNREIYVDTKNLPNEYEYKELNKEINKKFEDYLIKKGIKCEKEILEKSFITPDDCKVKKEFEKGSVFSVYSNELNKNVDLYVPNNNFEIIENKIKIEENYFVEKFEFALNAEREKIKNIQIISNENSIEVFKDFVETNQVVLKYEFKEFDKSINIYFDKSEFDFEDGAVKLGEKNYNNKLYDAKINFLSREFKDKKNEILKNNLTAKGYDITKIKNEKGKLVYQFPDKVPSKKELKNIELNSSVQFNKFLVDKNYIEERKVTTIGDWETKKLINANVIGETNVAKLITINDKRLDHERSIWVPNSMLLCESTEDKSELEKIVVNDKGEIEILKDFYENKIQELVENEKDNKRIFTDFSVFNKIEAIQVKDKESIKLSYEVQGLDKKIEFNINKEDVEIKEDGKILIQNEVFRNKYENHLIEASKNQYQKEYNQIANKVNEVNKTKTQFQKNKITEQNFKNFLSEKGILKDYYNDNYKIKGQVVEAKTNSSLISYKTNDEKEVRFWVNNKSINSVDKGEINFKNEKEITKLIENAENRFVEKNQMVKIDFDKIEIIDQKKKEGEEKIVVFRKEHKGLIKPIEIKFNLKELLKEGNEYKVEKYKLDYKIGNVVNSSSELEHQEKKEEIKKEVWKEKGFNPEKRKITKEDLKYFAKIENQRTYKSKNKHDYKFIRENETTQKKINELLKSPNAKSTKEIKKLEANLHRDKHTQEVIKEGTVKGGNNKHVHIIVSKYDATMPKHLKVSMSPTANQINSKMPNNGQQVGFNRSQFFEKGEKLFDQKFEYSRSYENTYQYSNSVAKLKSVGKSITTPLVNEIVKEIKKEVKNPITQLKQEINPIGKLKQELKFVPLPTNIPKSKLDLLIKMGKFLIQTADKGMKM